MHSSTILGQWFEGYTFDQISSLLTCTYIVADIIGTFLPTQIIVSSFVCLSPRLINLTENYGYTQENGGRECGCGVQYAILKSE